MKMALTLEIAPEDLFLVMNEVRIAMQPWLEVIANLAGDAILIRQSVSVH
jgi:hypothetical protein